VEVAETWGERGEKGSSGLKEGKERRGGVMDTKAARGTGLGTGDKVLYPDIKGGVYSIKGCKNREGGCREKNSPEDAGR